MRDLLCYVSSVVTSVWNALGWPVLTSILGSALWEEYKQRRIFHGSKDMAQLPLEPHDGAAQVILGHVPQYFGSYHPSAAAVARLLASQQSGETDAGCVDRIFRENLSGIVGVALLPFLLPTLLATSVIFVHPQWHTLLLEMIIILLLTASVIAACIGTLLFTIEALRWLHGRMLVDEVQRHFVSHPEPAAPLGRKQASAIAAAA